MGRFHAFLRSECVPDNRTLNSLTSELFSPLPARYAGGGAAQKASQPPSATTTAPLTKLASSEARKTAVLAISTASPARGLVGKVLRSVAKPRSLGSPPRPMPVLTPP